MSSSSPPYDKLSRDQLIAYCERLRAVLHAAQASDWAYLGDMVAAGEWEREACTALESHSTLPEEGEDHERRAGRAGSRAGP